MSSNFCISLYMEKHYNRFVCDYSNLLVFDYVFFFPAKIPTYPGSSLTVLELFLRVEWLAPSLACCSMWGCRVGHDWVTELNWKLPNKNSQLVCCILFLQSTHACIHEYVCSWPCTCVPSLALMMLTSQASVWSVIFLMFKLDFKKAEEQEIILLTSAGS